MEVKHLRSDLSEVTFQLLRLTCPHCKQAVQYAVQEEDRIYKEDAAYYEKRCEQYAKEISRLHQIINEILILKR